MVGKAGIRSGPVLPERAALEERLQQYQQQYEGYSLRIGWVDFKPYDPNCELLDVVLTTRDGCEYWANFTTIPYLQKVFEKNKRTGEQLSGTYFALPDNMVILGRLTEENIRRTIDDLIENQEVECYFKKHD